MSEETKPPLIFVSYSHDSPEHKRWVTEFASKLVHNGIDVILDQWDLGLGDDVPKFMEKSVSRAGRVLMVCTEKYVRKADDGKGGVGYEAMIVTGELVRDLGTSKFIPIVCQTTKPPILPSSVSTRFYVDFSDDDRFDEQLEVLLRELHEVPVSSKPAIGKNPFAVSPSGIEISIKHDDNQSTPRDIEGANDVSEIYRVALNIARRGDLLEWRSLASKARKLVNPRLDKWRSLYRDKVPTDATLVEESLDGISAFAPQMIIALAGVGSGREKFRNQLGLVDELLYPKEWNRGGYVARTSLPEASVYVYQALHGAMCIHTDQLGLAIDAVKAQFKFPDVSGSIPIWRHDKVMGWPDAFGGNSYICWQTLTTLPDQWTWLAEVFGEKEEFLTALCAYYMGLNVQELAELLASGKEMSLSEKSYYLDIPLHFQGSSDDIRRRAYRLLVQDPEQVRYIWTSIGVSDSKMREYWRTWIDYCLASMGNAHVFRFRPPAHASLIDEVLSRGIVNKK